MTISRPIPSTSSMRDFHATRPTSTFSATDFASLRRGSTATATFAGTCRRANGAGASCRGRVSPVSTLAISVRGRIDQEIAARQFAQSRWPSPAESEWHLGCQKDQKSAQEHALPVQVIGRVDGELSDRTTMVQGEQPAASAYDRTCQAGECVHFVANAKHR